MDFFPLIQAKVISDKRVPSCHRVYSSFTVMSGILSVLRLCFVSGLSGVSSAPLSQYPSLKESGATEELCWSLYMPNKCIFVDRWWVMRRSRCFPHRCPQHSFIRHWQYRHILTGWWTGWARIPPFWKKLWPGIVALLLGFPKLGNSRSFVFYIFTCISCEHLQWIVNM